MQTQYLEPAPARILLPKGKCMEPALPERASKQLWRDVLILAFIGTFAGVLLFWNLGRKYLWQDEAATAVLGERLLQHGKPLAYDGKNLVTIDYYAAEDLGTIEQRASDASSAIDYYVHRGDFKSDTTWIWQPWGQFFVAAAALKTFGHDTAGMRLPFAAASLLTVMLTYYLVRRSTGHRLIAVLAALLLCTNSYWLLHSRQCRYYSLSSFCLVLALVAYARWRRGARWGAGFFIVAEWFWFQVDYGTVLPISAVLFAYSLLTDAVRRRETIIVGAIFAGTIAPFCWYYQMAGRMSVRSCPLSELFFRHLFKLNQYIVPVLVLLAAALVLRFRRQHLLQEEKRLLKMALWIFPTLLFWLTMVTPVPFLRYSIIIAPVGAVVSAWTFVRGGEWLWAEKRWPVIATALTLSACLIASPWAGKPVALVVPAEFRSDTGSVIRTELSRLSSEIFGNEPDPNRPVVEWLKTHAAPTDEILITYEDLPLAFYLPNPIRGGIGAFRVTDDSKAPPKYVILRPSVWFVHQPVFARELNRFHWRPVENFCAPDVVWGNNPDPEAHKWDPVKPRNLQLLQRVD